MSTQFTAINPLSTIPKIPTFQQPIVAVGADGSAPGELYHPECVAVEPENGHIYVADCYNNRIQIFSETGQYIHHFGCTHLKEPHGMLFHEDSLYVTDWTHHRVLQFRLPDLELVKKVGQRGSGEKEFRFPCQLAISPNQQIYVADEFNDRLQILTTSLTFSDSLQHQTMTYPVNVKFASNEIFVLSVEDNPCIHVFSLSGEKCRSLVTRQDGMQVSYFCLDVRNNIFICDCYHFNIKVYSQNGDLLYTIGEAGHEAGMFHYPSGITLHGNKLICVSGNVLFGLQIFSAL